MQAAQPKGADMSKLLTRNAFTLAVAMAVTCSIVMQTATATIIAYDGFSAGGTENGRSAGATSYTTSPASTTGLNNDSLHTQSPISTGFADGDAWTLNDAMASFVYFQAQAGGLSYLNFEPRTSGQARYFRNSGVNSASKSATRIATTTDISDVQWVAMLLSFNSAPSPSTWYQDLVITMEYGEPGDSTAPYDGAWTPATFGVRQSDGKAFYRTAEGASKVDVATASALTTGTHLFLLKFDHGSAADPRYDDVTMWVDPVLTENPNFLVGGLSARSIMRADLGGGLHAFDEITIANAVQATHEIVFDEFIITDDYADIFDVVGVTRFQEGVSPTVAYTQDAVFIRENEPTANQNGDTDRELIVGFLNDDTEVRGLLEFDVSAIPASDTINSASLVLRQEAPQGGQGGSITVNLYEYDHDIVESVSDWNDPDGDGNDGTGDATRGGTFGSLLTSATFDANTQDADVTFSDSAAFRTAVSDALADDGVLRLIIARSDSSGSGYRFARFDDETVPHVAKRPELIVAHYDAPPHGTLFVIR